MKKILCLILVCCLCFVFAGCGPEYEDTNGDDNYELQTITDENIINLDTGAAGLNYEETNLGVLHSSKYTSKNFNGVAELYFVDFILPSDVTVYIGHMNVEGGNFKLVAINNDEIIHEFALDASGEDFLFENLSGTFAIRAAGENAKVDFNIQVN